MGAPSYAGYWVGKFEGTNQGGLAVEIKQDKGVLRRGPVQ